MFLQPFSFKKLIIKIGIIAIALYLTLVLLSILITGYIFFNLDTYKTRIQHVIYKHTRYVVAVQSLKTKLNRQFLPEILINGITIYNDIDKNQNIKIKNINLVLSYQSIWYLTPIFKNITINDSKLAIQITYNKDIIVNGLNLTTPDKKLLRNAKKSPIDIEAWIFRQQKINLTNIDLSISDMRNIIPDLKFNNVNMQLSNNLFKNHEFMVDLAENNNPTNRLGALFKWHGEKISDFKSWQSAYLKFDSYSKDNYFIINKLALPLPNLNLMKKFYTQTVLSAKMENGRLIYLNADFDIKNLQYFTRLQHEQLKFPNLQGKIAIKLINNEYYSINATKLTITTDKGYVVRNNNITGNYYPDRFGKLQLNNTNLKNFNNFLSMYQIGNGIFLNGNIESIQYSWLGNISKPTSYTIDANFNDISIDSLNNSVPNIDNISGEIHTSQFMGYLNLRLKDSTLKYKKVFLIDYVFKNFAPKISWINKGNGNFNVTLPQTNIAMKDFTGFVSGNYNHQPSSKGHLFLLAHLDKIPINKVNQYLPIQIGKPAHKWLSMGLVSGYGENGNLIFDGDLHYFPYKKNEGKFYIDADVNNGKVNFAHGWPTIDNVYAKFAIRNQLIKIVTQNAKTSNVHITKALVTIPDMTSKHGTVDIKATTDGNSRDYIRYLRNSPINQSLNHFPENITTNGNAHMSLNLSVPYSNPTKTTFSGIYTLQNNNITFNFPMPKIYNAKGDLKFSGRGITINNINFKILNSDANVSASSVPNGMMHFKVFINNLYYPKLSKLYLPMLESIAIGSAPTNLFIDIDKHGLNRIAANSNLSGVTVKAPPPFFKNEPAKSLATFALYKKTSNNFKLKFNYANLLYGNFNLDQNADLINGKIATESITTKRDITKNTTTTESTTTESTTTGSAITESAIKHSIINSIIKNATLNIHAKMPKMEVMTWLQTISGFLQATKNTCQIDYHHRNSKNSKEAIPKKDIFPINTDIETESLYIGSRNFKKVIANIYITKTATDFTFNGNYIDGHGQYSNVNNKLDLFFNYIHFTGESELLNNESASNSKAINESSTSNIQPKNSVPHLAITNNPESNINGNFELHNNIIIPNDKTNKPITHINNNESTGFIKKKCNFITIKKRDEILLTESQINTKYQNINLPNKIPNITLNIESLILNDNKVGKFNVNFISKQNDLIIESGHLFGEDANITFHGVNYCVECVSPVGMVDLDTNIQVKNLGNILDAIGYTKVVQNGKGSIKIDTQYDGKISDFDINTARAQIVINLSSGKFLQVKTNGVIAQIVRILTLQALVDIINFNFTSIFSSGFAFTRLNSLMYLVDDHIDIKQFEMIGTMAQVKLTGQIDIKDQCLDLLLTITPHLNFTAAVSVGVATLNPVIGVITYVAQWLLGSPFGKLFTFYYHISGTITHPTITKIKASKQIVKNVGSTVTGVDDNINATAKAINELNAEY